MRRLQGGALWRTWFVWVTVGELVGFAIPAVIGALTVAVPAAWQFGGLLAAGAAEGAVLGYAQSRVLIRTLPALVARRWIAATVIGAAAAAWLAAMTAVFVGPRVSPWPLAAALAALAGTVVLLSIGLAQTVVLRRLVPRAGWWIPATAAAWLAGLAVFMLVSTPLWQPGQGWPLVALIGVLAGTCMAATMAAVTGAAIVHLTRPVPVHSRS